MNYEVTVIPITRWKRDRRGVLPKTAPITLPVKLEQVSAPNIPAITDVAGKKNILSTVCTAKLPEMPKLTKNEGYERMIAWSEACTQIERHAMASLQLVVTDYKLEPTIVETIVPRGTFIGPVFEHQAKRPIVRSKNNSNVVTDSSKQASSIGNF